MSESQKLRVLIFVGAVVLASGVISLGFALTHLLGLTVGNVDGGLVFGRWVVTIVGIPAGTAVLVNTKELM